MCLLMRLASQALDDTQGFKTVGKSGRASQDTNNPTTTKPATSQHTTSAHSFSPFATEPYLPTAPGYRPFAGPFVLASVADSSLPGYLDTFDLEAKWSSPEYQQKWALYCAVHGLKSSHDEEVSSPEHECSARVPAAGCTSQHAACRTHKWSWVPAWGGLGAQSKAPMPESTPTSADKPAPIPPLADKQSWPSLPASAARKLIPTGQGSKGPACQRSKQRELEGAQTKEPMPEPAQAAADKVTPSSQATVKPSWPSLLVNVAPKLIPSAPDISLTTQVSDRTTLVLSAHVSQCCIVHASRGRVYPMLSEPGRCMFHACVLRRCHVLP